jgi:hypothetical protein
MSGAILLLLLHAFMAWKGKTLLSSQTKVYIRRLDHRKLVQNNLQWKVNANIGVTYRNYTTL